MHVQPGRFPAHIFFGMDPAKLLTLRDGQVQTMMDGIDEFSEQEVADLDKVCRAMEQNKQYAVVGRERLQLLPQRLELADRPHPRTPRPVQAR